MRDEHAGSPSARREERAVASSSFKYLWQDQHGHVAATAGKFPAAADYLVQLWLIQLPGSYQTHSSRKES